MKGTKILGMVLAVAVMVLMVAPIASAQTDAYILDDQWFKVKAGMKGYMLDAADNDNVLEKSSGSGTDYIQFVYSVGAYRLVTCAQDDQDPGIWHRTEVDMGMTRNNISVDNIYGPVYPQIWDFGGIPIVFYDGYSTYNLYPILYTKITAPNGVLTKATISTLSCGIWAEIQDLGERFNGIGSCSLTGSLIPADQVEKKVPYCCQHTCL